MKILLSTITAILIVANCFAQTTFKELSTADFKTKLAKDSTVQLVDVRTPEEFKAGHIENALNINYLDDNFETHIQKLDKNRPVLLYCKAGVRSEKAAAVMQKLGFIALYNLEGGYLKWNSEK